MKDYDQPFRPAPRVYLHADTLFSKAKTGGYYMPHAIGNFLSKLYDRYKLVLFTEKRLISRSYPDKDILADKVVAKLPDVFTLLRREGCPMIVFSQDPRFDRFDERYLIGCPYNPAVFDRLYAQFTVTVLGVEDERRSRDIVRNSERSIPKALKKGFGAKF